MKDIFFFDSMLTPKIITLIYWFLLFVACVVGLMFGGVGGVTFGKFILGIAIIIGGAVTARIWCELLIVLFKIDENIKKIADK